MIYGSSNCTQAALKKAVTDDGNIECDLMEVGKPNDFDYYFDAFDSKEQTEFKSHTLSFEMESNSKYYYKYGEFTEESMILHIGYNSIEEPEVFIGGEWLKPIISSGELLVTVPIELAENLPEIFDVVIKDAGEEIRIRCWTFSQEAISTYRQDYSERYSLKSFEYGSEGDKFIQDRINIMNAEATCLPEIKERNKKIALLNQLKQEQEEDSAEDNDFIVDIELLEEYRREKRQLKMVDHIRSLFFKRLAVESKPLFSLSRTNNSTARDKLDKTDNEPSKHVREATSEEEKFERFVRNRIKGMTNKEYVNVITPEHYMGIVAVLLDIFAKYRNVDLFDEYYELETRSNLFAAILMRDEWDETDEFNEVLLRNCFYLMIDNYVYTLGLEDLEDKEYINAINKKLLKAMEKRFSIRSTYQEFLGQMTNSESEEIQIDVPNSFFNYIERLFGYKNYDQLIDYIGTFYEDTEVKLNGEKLQIVGKVEKIANELKPNQLILREIWNYSREMSPVKTISISIKPLDPVNNTSNIVQIDQLISLSSHNWSQTICYKNGNRINEKPEYIDI